MGGLEELDDEIKAAGSTATLVPLDLKDRDGIARLALALNERYGRLDVLSAMPACSACRRRSAMSSPRTGTTYGGQRHRQLAAHPLHGPAAQARRRGPRGVPDLGLALDGRAYWGAYAASKAALEALVRTYAAECATTNVRANLFSPGRTRTRMMATAFPGVDPADAADARRGGEGDRAAVPAGLRGDGKLYDFRKARFLEFQPPA